MNINDDQSKAALSSLHLNVAKCYEDMREFPQALENYRLAGTAAQYLNADGYGDMIRAGIQNGIRRVSK